MSTFSQFMTNPLNIGGNFKEVIQEILKKDRQLRTAVQETFIKVKLYQRRESWALANNSTLESQLSNLSQGNQGLIDAIAQNTVTNDELKKQFDDHENQNAVERKDTREALQREAGYYGCRMVDAQDEYKSVNLKNDIDLYKEQLSIISSKIDGLTDITEALDGESETVSPSQELADIDKLIRSLKDDEEALVRDMRSKESTHLMLLRDIKQFETEMSQLQNK